MKIVKLAAAAIAASALWTAAPARAQTPTHAIPSVDCSKSFLAMNPTLTCMASRGVTNDNRIGGKEYHVAGVLADRSLFMVLTMPPFTGSIRPYSEQGSVAALKNLNDLTRRQGKDWSAITTDTNTSYLNFKTDNQTCIGFDHAGPLKDGGYAWTLRGYLCTPAGAQPVSYDVVKSYLAATRVGNTRDNLNAYGQAVKTLAQRPSS